MKITEIKECLQSNTDWASASDAFREARKKFLVRLLDQLTFFSVNTLLEFQRDWDKTKPYTEFVKAQNKCLLTLINLEQDSIGEQVRELFDLKPLTNETEV